jgi:hypothetical protein
MWSDFAPICASSATLDEQNFGVEAFLRDGFGPIRFSGIIAERDGGAVGYRAISPATTRSGDRVMYIVDLWVDPPRGAAVSVAP